MTLTNVHDRLSVTIVLYAFILAIWGMWRYYRKQGLDGNFWGALAINEILILIQAVLGVILWTSALRPERGYMHILYGVVSALTIPATYAFTRGRDTAADACLWLALIALVCHRPGDCQGKKTPPYLIRRCREAIDYLVDRSYVRRKATISAISASVRRRQPAIAVPGRPVSTTHSWAFVS
jgi:hypothetical protein